LFGEVEEERMDVRLVGTWRIEAVATSTGDFDAPDPAWATHRPDPGQGVRLGAVAHTFRADGTGQIESSSQPARSAERFTWRVEKQGGQLYLTLDTPDGPVSMRVWLRPDGRLVWEQNIFSRWTEGRRVWLNLTSGEWVGREWPSQFHGSTAFVLARDDDPIAGRG
jgi:hypothetical protein